MPLLPRRGRPSVPMAFEFVRPLQLEDIMRLATLTDAPKFAAYAPKTLRAVHHRAAEMLASGKGRSEVAHELGMTPQRIGDLMHSPAFCELVNYFSEQISEATIEIRQRIETQVIDISEMALGELQERLETKPESIPAAELRQIAAMGLDRTVLPPKPAMAPAPPTMQVTFNMGPRALTPRTVEGELIEAEPIAVPASTEPESPE